MPARTRDSLLLAAGQFRGFVVEAVAQSDRVNDDVEPLRVDLLPGDIQRSVMFSFGGQRRNEVEALKDKPDLLPTQLCEGLVRQFGEINIANEDVACGGRIEACQTVHECFT